MDFDSTSLLLPLLAAGLSVIYSDSRKSVYKVKPMPVDSPSKVSKAKKRLVGK